MKGNRTLATLAKWRMIRPDIPVKIFENISWSPNNSKVMRSIEVWDLEESWKEKDTIHRKFSL